MSGLTGTEVPRKGLRVRVPCPPLKLIVICSIKGRLAARLSKLRIEHVTENGTLGVPQDVTDLVFLKSDVVFQRRFS